MTSPLPKKFTIHSTKNRIPNMWVIRGCWGGNLAQWSLTTSFRSSGRSYNWLKPVCSVDLRPNHKTYKVLGLAKP